MSARVVVRSARPRPEEAVPGPQRALSKLLKERAMRRPNFSSCWTVPSLPANHRVVESYEVGGATVKIAASDSGTGFLYHIAPWEYELPEAWIAALNQVIQKVSLHPPADVGAPAEELRAHVRDCASRYLHAAASRGGLELVKCIEERETVIHRLSDTVARYTVGLGLFEVLLSDDRIEDIYIDAPAWANPVHLTVNGIGGTHTVGRCLTNMTASPEEVGRLVSHLRQASGRPFSEAFPVMETDVDGYDTRATVIGPPLSPEGTAVALRRHARTPWTLLKLAYNGSIDAPTAGLLSFLIDGRSTILVCGARGAGKSSLLSAMMFEFPLSQRILTIEDTLELPTRAMQSLGYKVQSLFVETRLDQSNEEMADQALRVSLRLGESAIVLGEVRGKEAQTLYQSMRTGRAGSSVLGTIHGDSARSVYERVVHDMGIPREAFLATDLVLTMGLSRPGGSSRPVRRLIEVAECRRGSEDITFNQLLERKDDASGMTDGLARASTVVARIARSWDMTVEEALENIHARSCMRESLLNAARTSGPRFLEPAWVIRCNDFLVRRLDQGDRDYPGIVEDFDRYVRGRCGVALE